MIMMIREQELKEQAREEGREEGRAAGREEGRVAGREEGESRLGALIARLFAANRAQDAARAATDSAFRERLYSEFDI